MASEVSNHARYVLATGLVDFSSDTFKVILMDSGFSFDPDNHALYADVSADELPTGNGYVQNTKTLGVPVITEDDAQDLCTVEWPNITWTAVGGDIGPTPGIIIFDDSAAGDPIIGYIDFGEEVTQMDGGVLTIMNIEVDV